MAAPERLIEVLSYGPTLDINFRYRDLIVNRHLFETVSNAARTRRISVVHAPGLARSNSNDGRTDADYNWRTNRMSIYGTDLTDIYVETGIVHESVHAGFDLLQMGHVRTRQMIFWMRESNNYDWCLQETMAFLADARFWLNKGCSPNEWVRRTGYPSVMRMAQTLTPGYQLTRADIDPAFFAIQAAYPGEGEVLNNG